MRRVVLPILLAAAVCSISAARTLQGIMVVEGTCNRFTALGIDLTDHCQSRVSSNSFDDGRASFTYIAEPPDKPPFILTFSGQGKGQVKQSADIAVQPIDLLLTNLDGKVLTDKAVGICRFGNPYKPDAVVNCFAETSDGTYAAQFTGNNKEPSRFTPGKNR